MMKAVVRVGSSADDDLGRWQAFMIILADVDAGKFMSQDSRRPDAICRVVHG